jgi:20S proteasome alpha/beta subunit
MTLVIGAIIDNFILLASDGYALFQADHDEPTYKLDTYSKIKLLSNQRIVFGFAGSHEIGIKFLEGFRLNKNNDESVFLESLSNDLREINSRDEHKKAAAIVGYRIYNTPRLVLFPHAGGYEIQTKLCAIGAGADIAMDYLSLFWRNDFTIIDGMSTIIESVYKASIVPTVNFLPMIIVLGDNIAYDLSEETINAINGFKSDLKDKLITKIQSLIRSKTT